MAQEIFQAQRERERGSERPKLSLTARQLSMSSSQHIECEEVIIIFFIQIKSFCLYACIGIQEFLKPIFHYYVYVSCM